MKVVELLSIGGEMLKLMSANEEHTEIMAALQQQRDMMDDLSRRVERFPFASNLLSSVTGNFIAYFAIKLLNK